jgi:hypothetical protein
VIVNTQSTPPTNETLGVQAAQLRYRVAMLEHRLRLQRLAIALVAVGLLLANVFNFIR